MAAGCFAAGRRLHCCSDRLHGQASSIILPGQNLTAALARYCTSNHTQRRAVPRPRHGRTSEQQHPRAGKESRRGREREGDCGERSMMEFASSGEGSLFDGRWAKRSSDEVLILSTCSPPVLVLAAAGIKLISQLPNCSCIGQVRPPASSALP
jgi:hypothetical protein